MSRYATEVEVRALLFAIGNERPSRDQVEQVQRLLSLTIKDAHWRLVRGRDRWRRRAETLRSRHCPELSWDDELE